MSLSATEGNLRQAPRTNGTSKSFDETFSGPVTEHIYIGDEFADQAGEPTIVLKHMSIRNRVHGTNTEFTFFDEGFLKIREVNEVNRKKLKKEHVLELRFVNPEPVTTRRIATAWLWSSLGIGMLALIASFGLPLTSFAQYTISSTAVLATLATLSLLLFVYRSAVRHQFRTVSGQAVVLSLTCSFGRDHRMRAIVREIREAIIRASAETGAHDVRYLRAEIQAHYELTKTGVITREACSNGTARILSKFG